MPPGGDTIFRKRAGAVATVGRVFAAFGLLILIGTVLLHLPQARVEGVRVGWLDSLFVATSAACVTGLSTVNVGEVYTPFGQAVLLGLIQFGGLGIVTAGTLFLLVRRGSGSQASEDFIGANVGRLREARPVDVFIYACTAVLAVELFGTVVLTHLVLEREPDLPFARAVWVAAFHSISAFCNAGFSTFPEGLVRWRDDPRILLLVCLLVILGGIGLLTLVNFRYFYPWRRDRLRRGRLTLQTRLCLAVTAALLVFGTLFSLANESDHSLRDQPWPRALLWSFVHATMLRTAGFNVVDVESMAPETLLGSIGLMFVGGAPGSMAGGIKVTTLVLLAAAAWSALRRRSDLVLGRNAIPPEQANNAVMIVLLSAATLTVALGLLMNFEARSASSQTEFHWLGLVFEAVSAFCTVGLSAGVTPLLSPAGKLVIIALMFLGRLGPLCLAMHLMRPVQPARVAYPRTDLSVG